VVFSLIRSKISQDNRGETMTFLWPSMLLFLLVVPALIGFYLLVDRHRRSRASQFNSLQPVRKQGPGLRRHLPPLLFLLSLLILLIALARPQAEVRLPRVEGTVILVFDVSASMGADDVDPTRMESAKAAAREFVLSQPETVRIGIVSFSGSGFAVQTPTNDANVLLAAIDRLEPASGTSLGQGIFAALNTIALDAGLLTTEQTASEDTTSAPGSEQGNQGQTPEEEDLLAQLPEGPYPSSVIVLLSDGENNQSIDPLAAAQAAAERDVRIDTLGFGTPAGTTLELDGFIVHTALDEAALQQLAQTAGGSYFAAQSEQDPQAVYASLAPELVVKTENMEITSILAGASILILLLGSLFSMLWFNRLV
jgi:Ca-activated chloride channel family protein